MNRATKRNLDRKSAFVDEVKIHDGVPLFSWIDLNITELCNRKCVFCPRSKSDVYPNQKLFLKPDLASKMAQELKEIHFDGAVVFCGFSEPLLHPDFTEIIQRFGHSIRTELVTNGDKLTTELIAGLYDAGLDYIAVSMYDGEQQTEKFEKMFRSAGINQDHFILRDRWHHADEEYGLKLTNRAGTLNLQGQLPVDTTKPCYYTHYSMTVDWNGDVLLCVQDWNKKVKLGNLYGQSIMEVWKGHLIENFRKRLAQGPRNFSPCKSCNVEGTFHGFNHVRVWQHIWESQKGQANKKKLTSAHVHHI
ncbi:MAG: radical SAM/SPASM domain-containing protein [Verrucomicrobiota bacterium]